MYYHSADLQSIHITFSNACSKNKNSLGTIRITWFFLINSYIAIKINFWNIYHAFQQIFIKALSPITRYSVTYSYIVTFRTFLFSFLYFSFFFILSLTLDTCLDLRLISNIVDRIFTQSNALSHLMTIVSTTFKC